MTYQEIVDIISSSSKKSFIYHLHYKNKFSKTKFKKLECAYKYYINNVMNFNPQEKSLIVKEFIYTFEHTLFLFMCDSNPSDFYKISNLNTQDDKTKIYFNIRNMTENLINTL